MSKPAPTPTAPRKTPRTATRTTGAQTASQPTTPVALNVEGKAAGAKSAARQRAAKAPASKQAARSASTQAVDKPTKPTKPTKPAKVVKVAKPEKIKIVRDSFTMPEADFALIEAIKQRALGWKQPAKKSEVLRAALQALQALPDAQVRQLLTGLTPIKKGRPQKQD